MKVLHLCPLWFPVGRDSPGGIETYLPVLLVELERLGCDNTLLASADSDAGGTLVPVVERNIWEGMEDGSVWDYGHYQQHQLLLALEMAAEFDVVHSHIDWAAYVLSGLEGTRDRLLITQHTPVTRDVEWFVARHPGLRFSTVSEFQARKLRDLGATDCEVIPNGIDMTTFELREQATGEDIVFIGRMEQQKGPDIAVRVARALGRRLTIAGPMTDHEFFDAEIRPWLDEQVRYVGVVDHARKNELLGGAACVLMPSRWEEPFGLVAVEAMACGTPVVALRSGALPEVVEHGVSGLIADEEDGLPDAVKWAAQLDRRTVRGRAERRFDMRRVASRYADLYERIGQGTHATAAQR